MKYQYTVRNIPKFKDRANWSRDTFQPMRRRACVYQQTNQNIAAVIKTADGVGQNQSSFRGSQAYFKDFSWGIHNFFKWIAHRKPYWKCLVKYSAHFVAYFFFKQRDIWARFWSVFKVGEQVSVIFSIHRFLLRSSRTSICYFFDSQIFLRSSTYFSSIVTSINFYLVECGGGNLEFW